MNEQARRRAVAANTTDAYTTTVESIEPDVHPIDASAFYASAAISLKRIADVAELFAISLLTDHAKKDTDMADWAKRHGFGDLWPGKRT